MAAQMSKPVVIFIGIAVAGIAVFGAWWFFLRSADVSTGEPVRRVETIDAGVLRDARYDDLRAPAVPQESVRKGRANPFTPAPVGTPLPLPEASEPSGPEAPLPSP